VLESHWPISVGVKKLKDLEKSTFANNTGERNKMLGRQKLILLAKTSRALSTSAANHAKQTHQFVVVGGGAGGLSIAASLSRTFGKGRTAVVEPSEVS
jgi:adenine/guanine phosphoribosyltransferase-like PRPP-binding protein